VVTSGFISTSLQTFPNGLNLGAYITCLGGYSMSTDPKALTCLCPMDGGTCSTLLGACNATTVSYSSFITELATVRGDPPLPDGLLSPATLLLIAQLTAWLYLGHYLGAVSYDYTDSRSTFIGLKAVVWSCVCAFLVMGFGIDDSTNPAMAGVQTCYHKRVAFNFLICFCICFFMLLIEIVKSRELAANDAEKDGILRDRLAKLEVMVYGHKVEAQTEQAIEGDDGDIDEDAELLIESNTGKVTTVTSVDTAASGAVAANANMPVKIADSAKDKKDEETKGAVDNSLRLMDKEDQIQAIKDIRRQLARAAKGGAWYSRVKGVKLTVIVPAILCFVGIVVCALSVAKNSCSGSTQSQ